MKAEIISLAAAAALALPAAAAPIRTVAVRGTGNVQVVPNIAAVNIQIVEKGGVDVAPLALQQKNQVRVAESLPVIKELVGKSGTVQVIPSIAKVMEYNRTTGAQDFKGYQAVTSIQVTLRGEAAVEQKLGALFDTSKIKADDVTVTAVGLSDRREQAATRVAFGKAMSDARNRAQAQLEAGEKLGPALARGQSAQVYSPRGGAVRAMAAMAPEAHDAGGGGMTAELGKVTVSANTAVTFKVKGQADRLKKGKK
jgi:uncharacterized protein YggE